MCVSTRPGTTVAPAPSITSVRRPDVLAHARVVADGDQHAVAPGQRGRRRAASRVWIEAPSTAPSARALMAGIVPRPMPISHWFSQLDPPPAPRPLLPGPREADVCIVGGGFTGLWTALRAAPRRPVARRRGARGRGRRLRRVGAQRRLGARRARRHPGHVARARRPRGPARPDARDPRHGRRGRRGRRARGDRVRLRQGRLAARRPDAARARAHPRPRGRGGGGGRAGAARRRRDRRAHERRRRARLAAGSRTARACSRPGSPAGSPTRRSAPARRSTRARG